MGKETNNIIRHLFLKCGIDQSSSNTFSFLKKLSAHKWMDSVEKTGAPLEKLNKQLENSSRSIPGIFSSFSHVNGAAHASTNYMILFFFFSRINGEQRIQVTTETGATPMAGERLYYNYKLTVAYRFINR